MFLALGFLSIIMGCVLAVILYLMDVDLIKVLIGAVIVLILAILALFLV